jgi:hypothetical protein
MSTFSTSECWECGVIFNPFKTGYSNHCSDECYTDEPLKCKSDTYGYGIELAKRIISNRRGCEELFDAPLPICLIKYNMLSELKNSPNILSYNEAEIIDGMNFYKGWDIEFTLQWIKSLRAAQEFYDNAQNQRIKYIEIDSKCEFFTQMVLRAIDTYREILDINCVEQHNQFPIYN